MHKRFHSSLLKALLEKTTEKEIKFLVIIKRMHAHTHLLTWNTFIFYFFTNLQKISELKIGKRQSSHATSFAVSPEVGLNESPLSSCWQALLIWLVGVITFFLHFYSSKQLFAFNKVEVMQLLEDYLLRCVFFFFNCIISMLNALHWWCSYFKPNWTGSLCALHFDILYYVLRDWGKDHLIKLGYIWTRLHSI